MRAAGALAPSTAPVGRSLRGARRPRSKSPAARKYTGTENATAGADGDATAPKRPTARCELPALRKGTPQKGRAVRVVLRLFPFLEVGLVELPSCTHGVAPDPLPQDSSGKRQFQTNSLPLYLENTLDSLFEGFVNKNM